MEVPHEISRASKLVTELTLLQLLTCFLFSLARADPFVVATLVGLYAVRENDRRALDLYLLLVGVGGALDVLFLLIFEPSPIVLIGMPCLPHSALPCMSCEPAATNTAQAHESLPRLDHLRSRNAVWTRAQTSNRLAVLSALGDHAADASR